MSTSPAVAPLELKKPLTSSILLWVRTDQPRQAGIDHRKGPHSGIISATPGLEEYRQIHLAEHNPGLWSATDGVQTAIHVYGVTAALTFVKNGEILERHQE